MLPGWFFLVRKYGLLYLIIGEIASSIPSSLKQLPVRKFNKHMPWVAFRHATHRSSIFCFCTILLYKHLVIAWAWYLGSFNQLTSYLVADWHPIRGWVGIFEWECKEIHSATSYLPSTVIHWKVSTSSPFSYWSCWKDVNIWPQAENYRWVISLNNTSILILWLTLFDFI